MKCDNVAYHCLNACMHITCSFTSYFLINIQYTAVSSMLVFCNIRVTGLCLNSILLYYYTTLLVLQYAVIKSLTVYFKHL